MTTDELHQQSANQFNDTSGILTGYDCPRCKNKGFIMHYGEAGYSMSECSCSKVRHSLKLIENSGLRALIERYTFDAYKTDTALREELKNKAKSFLADFFGKWFFMGGQPGSGKSHLCTAIVGSLLREGHAARYMMWRDDGTRLKSLVNDSGYDKEIRDLQNTEILYIDDFLKGSVSPADINLAFQLLNFRYNNCLTTIISSELLLADINQIDEAIGSRIFERAGEYVLNISKDKAKNYRMRGEKLK